MQSKLVEVYHTVEERCHPASTHKTTSDKTKEIEISKESSDRQKKYHYQVYPFL
jgi:hypothetical protein